MEELLSRLRDRLTYTPAVEADGKCIRTNEAGDILPSRPPNAAISQVELTAVEASLGFALPPVIRRISTEIADGGFGPAWGINRVKHPANLPFGPHWQVRMSVESWHQLYHDEYQESLDHYPRQFIRYCEVGCNISVCVDCTTRHGQVFIDDPNIEPAIQYQNQSVIEWLELWLEKPWPTTKYA